MRPFVWTKMGAEGGQTLRKIVAIKEAERQAGAGVFWWGIGNSLGGAVRSAAMRSGGTLPIVFSTMLSRPRRTDSHPDHVFLWEEWEDAEKVVRPIPSHVLEWSRGQEGKKFHYALVCKSDEPLIIHDTTPFDSSKCLTEKGKKTGSSQVTALLEGNLDGDHSRGEYQDGFRATLVEPWFVKLTSPRYLSVDERDFQNSWNQGGDWNGFVRKLRNSAAT